MSRTTVFKSNRIEIVMGEDHVLGQFIQMYDNDLSFETPEGEGLIFDWSRSFGLQTNLTGISNSKYQEHVKLGEDIPVMFMTMEYLKQEEPEEYQKELGEALGMFDTYKKTLMN